MIDPLPLSSAILLVEDEPVLRSSIARGLGRLTNVDVLSAASVTEALALLESRAPSLLISDIDLPGASGLELIGQLRRRGINIPVILVTAYLKTYRTQIPEHPNVVVLEKPIPLDELRTCAKQLLGPAGDAMRAPFNLIDYVQLACLGRRSVRIDVEYGGGCGQVVVHDGEIWFAVDHQGDGPAAFGRLAFVPDAMVSCCALAGEVGPRNVTTRWEQLVLDSARAFDESEHERQNGTTRREAFAIGKVVGQAAPPPPAKSARPASLPPPASPSSPLPASASASRPARSASTPSPAPPPRARPDPASAQPPKPPARTMSGRPGASPTVPPGARQPTFDELWASGVDALLNRELEAAACAFAAAGRLRPLDPGVQANLRRLKEMGYDGEGGAAK